MLPVGQRYGSIVIVLMLVIATVIVIFVIILMTIITVNFFVRNETTALAAHQVIKPCRERAYTPSDNTDILLLSHGNGTHGHNKKFA